MEHLKELIYKIADDQLIVGHRNAEWTGIGPLLEEDIAFASMAQDKVGQSHQLYTLLHHLGESEPDTLAFMRNANQFHCCHLVELPIGEYDFSLIRHFLFDYAEAVRFKHLKTSSYKPLAQLATKLEGEIRYHIIHANAWIKKLGNSNALERMQQSLDYAFPFALGIFESSPLEQQLIDDNIAVAESTLRDEWLQDVNALLAKTQLELPEVKLATPQFGGRVGNHTAHLQPLLDEMSEVFRVDPAAEW
jgi:ring-1,2-phenylacetyl-CoA epoxidase subunit PaaC